MASTKKIKGFALRHDGQIYSPMTTQPLYTSYQYAYSAAARNFKKYGGKWEVFEANLVLVRNCHALDWDEKKGESIPLD